MDLSDIDLNLLVSLEILLQECNVTHAAQRLHVSQPAMSAQLARLRSTFNDPLLLPAERGRGMTPTALGLTLAGPLSTALKGLESVVRFQPSFDPHVDARTFHVAASDDAMIALGLRLIEQLSSYPQIRIIFHRPRPELIAADLERGTMDLLIDAERLIPQSMKARELSNGRFVMAQRPGHPRGAASLDLNTYCDLQHVLFSSADGVPQGYMDEYLATVQRQRQVLVTVPQLSLVAQILRNSNYVCTLPITLFNNFGTDLELFELPFAAPSFHLMLAWHPRSHYDPAVGWLRDLIGEQAKVLNTTPKTRA